jgi:hypothetical protein
MKIGIVATGFNIKEHGNYVLSAWIKQKENNKEHEFIISVNYGIFDEYIKLYKNNNIKIEEDGSLERLKELKNNGKIDYIFEHNGLQENEARNGALKYLLDNNVDVVWILDLVDEIYTEEEINKIIKYIQKYPSTDYYKINFKNYVFDNKHYVLGFCPSRIFWNNKHNGIKRFSWDNDIEYNDGMDSRNCVSIEIPRNFAFIKHYTWCGSKEYIKNKIAYQYLHFGNGNCSYKWHDKLNEMIFDDDFYKRYNMQKPMVYEDFNKQF